jgi:hypothetical protein
MASCSEMSPGSRSLCKKRGGWVVTQNLISIIFDHYVPNNSISYTVRWEAATNLSLPGNVFVRRGYNFLRFSLFRRGLIFGDFLS